jgi:ribosomal protein L11 methyltransferase
MYMFYTQVTIPNCMQAQQEIAIALLSQLNYEGFEQTDDALIAFIPQTLFNATKLTETLQPLQLTYTTTQVAQQNWNAIWESSFEPVVVENFVSVRADFHAPNTTVQHDIVITPKMSFGTGHHATTYMVMAAMQSINFTNASVYDFGTGTGVLAILAEKLGATYIKAIDNDTWSIENTNENIVANNCNNITVALAETIFETQTYDIVIANINLNVITAAINQIKSICHVGTHLLFSGFLTTDLAAITQVFTNANLTIVATFNKSNWLCIKCICN